MWERSDGRCTGSDPMLILWEPSGKVSDIRGRVAVGVVTRKKGELILLVSREEKIRVGLPIGSNCHVRCGR